MHIQILNNPYSQQIKPCHPVERTFHIFSPHRCPAHFKGNFRQWLQIIEYPVNLYKIQVLIFMITIFKNINYRNLISFSTKKQYEKGLLKVNKQKLDQTIGGHLIYQSQKSRSFFITGLAILSGLGLSVLIYQIEGTINNLIPLIICIGATIFYQRRLFNTVKKIIIQKSGEDMRIQRYGILGSEFMGKTLVTPIYLMQGVSKRSINRGVVIEGGGKFGYESFKYYFHSQGVQDKPIFDAVMSGTCLKYVDKF